ncbi:hypothetical protein [Aurantiacibacter gangjinensis]|uniref:Uncharacterized protein n=1 Tax=Aurantiacibacter gangjinensis TaxID=502682 RepID=A0A0G9MQT3_9SPHN|nr:hypothetical protein [Aurantiacibacter gangjinensis]APE28995.1 hypothetical protein BMF35_a2166 [Aurantiacibacter gangjinensis]KLE33106.1 hypothetical protein AAW01_03710 [Aurantiacibacter gangjinensis]
MSAEDLSGQWSGEYAYPQGFGPVTPFLAIIEDKGGYISGTIVEPDMIGGETLEALIVGTRGGTGVDFTKVYAPSFSARYSNPVDYVGSVQDDGMTIRGMWSLLDLDGRFEMRREFTREELLEREAEAKVPTTISP